MGQSIATTSSYGCSMIGHRDSSGGMLQRLLEQPAFHWAITVT